MFWTYFIKHFVPAFSSLFTNDMSLWQLFTWLFTFLNIDTISCSFTVSNQVKALYNKRSALITWTDLESFNILFYCCAKIDR